MRLPITDQGRGKAAAGGSTTRWPRRCRPPGNAQRRLSPRTPAPGPRHGRGTPRGKPAGAEPRAPPAPQEAAIAIPSAPHLHIVTFAPGPGQSAGAAHLLAAGRGRGGLPAARLGSPAPQRTAPAAVPAPAPWCAGASPAPRTASAPSTCSTRCGAGRGGGLRGTGFGGQGCPAGLGESPAVCVWGVPLPPGWAPLPSPRRERGHGRRGAACVRVGDCPRAAPAVISVSLGGGVQRPAVTLVVGVWVCFVFCFFFFLLLFHARTRQRAEQGCV